MTDPVAIANKALTKLGAERILLLEDDVKAARVMKALFADVRDAELAAYHWKFAIRRAQLPALVDAPAFGYEFTYLLPRHYLALVQLNDLLVLARRHGKPWWSIEGDRLLSDWAPPLRIRYVARVEDYRLFSPLFVEVLACKLALEACESLTQSNTKKQNLWQEYEQALRRAIRQDAVETAPDVAVQGNWLAARESGGMTGSEAADSARSGGFYG